MSRRTEQINSVFQKDIAEYIIRHGFVKDFVITVTYVLVSDDLSHAEVGVVTFPEDKIVIEKLIYALKNNRNELQLSLSRNHNLKKIPVLTFIHDIYQNKVERVEELLEEVNHEGR